jgi:hypothetical protein
MNRRRNQQRLMRESSEVMIAALPPDLRKVFDLPGILKFSFRASPRVPGRFVFVS